MRRIGFAFHAVAFVLVMSLLFVINLLTGGNWILWAFFGWGFGLFVHWLTLR